MVRSIDHRSSSDSICYIVDEYDCALEDYGGHDVFQYLLEFSSHISVSFSLKER